MLEENVQNLKNLEKDARAIQSSNQKHESIIHIAENDHHDVNIQTNSACRWFKESGRAS